jgi:hypothetical protein
MKINGRGLIYSTSLERLDKITKPYYVIRFPAQIRAGAGYNHNVKTIRAELCWANHAFRGWE